MSCVCQPRRPWRRRPFASTFRKESRYWKSRRQREQHSRQRNAAIESWGSRGRRKSNRKKPQNSRFARETHRAGPRCCGKHISTSRTARSRIGSVLQATVAPRRSRSSSSHVAHARVRSQFTLLFFVSVHSRSRALASLLRSAHWLGCGCSGASCVDLDCRMKASTLP